MPVNMCTCLSSRETNSHQDACLVICELPSREPWFDRIVVFPYMQSDGGFARTWRGRRWGFICSSLNPGKPSWVGLNRVEPTQTHTIQLWRKDRERRHSLTLLQATASSRLPPERWHPLRTFLVQQETDLQDRCVAPNTPDSWLSTETSFWFDSV